MLSQTPATREASCLATNGSQNAPQTGPASVGTAAGAGAQKLGGSPPGPSQLDFGPAGREATKRFGAASSKRQAADVHLGGREPGAKQREASASLRFADDATLRCRIA
jgi:hypothetical protein